MIFKKFKEKKISLKSSNFSNSDRTLKKVRNFHVRTLKKFEPASSNLEKTSRIERPTIVCSYKNSKIWK